MAVLYTKRAKKGIWNSKLMLTELDLHEYAYYVNVGATMEDVMAALRS